MKQFITIVSIIISSSVSSIAQTLIINEVSQGSSGNEDWIELLVIGDCKDNPTLDLRGWIIDDNNQTYSTIGSSKDGCIRFSNHNQWKNVPIGTLIVIYNIDFPTNEFIELDDTLDANKDNVYILPIKTSLLEYSQIPKKGLFQDYSSNNSDYKPPGMQTGLASTISSVASEDVFQIRNPTNTKRDDNADFSIFWGTTLSVKNAIRIGSSMSGSSNKVGYVKDSLYYLSNPTGWTLGDISTETPGAGNTPENASWIKNLKNIIRPKKNITVGATNNKKSYCKDWNTSAGDPIPNTTIEIGTIISTENGVSYTLRNDADNSVATTTSQNPQNGNSGTLFFEVAPTITTTYNILATDNISGCVSQLDSTITITVLPKPELSETPGTDLKAFKNDPICKGEVVDYVLFQVTNTQLTNYLWSNNPSFSPILSTDNSPTIKADQTRRYYFKGTDGNGCYDTTSLVITINDTPMVVITSPIIDCPPANIQEIVTDENDNKNVSFSFFSDVLLSNPVVNPTNVTISGDYFVKSEAIYPISDPPFTYTCSAKPKKITINDAPTPTIITNCNNSEFKHLTAEKLNVGSKYDWYVEGISSILVKENSAILHENELDDLLPPPDDITIVSWKLIETFANNCSGFSTISYADIKAPKIVVTDTSICSNATVDISLLKAEDTNPLTAPNDIISYHSIYSTNHSSNLLTNTLLNPAIKTDIFALKIEGSCISVDTLTITIFPRPIASFAFSPQEINQSTEQVKLLNSSKNSSSYLWEIINPVSQITSINSNPTIILVDTGLYIIKLTATSKDKCIDSISKSFYVKADFNVFSPASFTPNNDGYNDFFIPIINNKNIMNYTLEIFNKWGELIFNTNNPDDIWDGRYKGYESPVGTYIYFISYQFEGNVISKNGSIILYR